MNQKSVSQNFALHSFTAHLVTPAIRIVEPAPNVHNIDIERALRSQKWVRLCEVAESAAHRSHHSLPLEFFPLGSNSLLINFGYIMNDQKYFPRQRYNYLTPDGKCFFMTTDLPSSGKVLVPDGWGKIVSDFVGKNVVRVTIASVPGKSQECLVAEFRDGSCHFLDRKKGAWNWKIEERIPEDSIVH